MSTLPPDYDSDPGRFLAGDEFPHDDVHPHVAARLAGAGTRSVLDVGGGSHPELASVRPGWGAGSPFDGEDAAAIVASVFSVPGDRVEVERWDAPLLTLETAGHAASFLRVHGMSAAGARDAARKLDLPLTLTMRGCVVYATKAP
jgi:hypothetical protein